MDRGSVLVIGGGVAGLQASADLASTYRNVYLIEREPRLGGHTPLLHRLFPTMELAEKLTERLVERVLQSPNVTVLTHSEIESVKGSFGNFEVRVLKRARYVDGLKCTNCGECEKACPVNVPIRFEMKLTSRKAIYLPKPFAVPASHLIDEETCLRFKGEVCKACQDVCPEKAVSYNQRGVYEELSTSAVLLTTGFSEYDAGAVGQYKHGVYPNVITGMEYERLCSPTGPTSGKILKADGGEPRSVAFILCVGSRDVRHLNYCCSIGCLNALKHALYLKQQYEKVDTFVCYTDMRAITKWGERLYQKARMDGIEFIRGQPSEVLQTHDGSLTLDVYDQATSKLLSITADMIVLEVGFRPQVGLFRKLQLTVDENGFPVEKHPQLAPNETLREGVFLAGAVRQPMHVYEALLDASATAMKIMSFTQR